MVATGREPTLPPDIHLDAHPSPSVDDPSEYVEALSQWLQLTHQQVTSPPPPPVANLYHVGSLIYALTTPPERASKLSPRWKGPYRVCRIPNDHQVVYEDGELERTIHVNHAKPAKFTAPDLLEPVPSPEAPHPPLGYLPPGLALLLRQPLLLGSQPPLQQPRQPISSQHPLLSLKTLCYRPLLRQPISDQNPLLIPGDLPG